MSYLNKTQARKQINKEMYEFAESLGYDVSDSDGGRVTFSKGLGWEDDIEYSRSSFDICYSGNAKAEIKYDCTLMENKVLMLIKKYLH